MANVFDIPARDFNYYLAEQASMGRPQAEIDNLRRRYRDANSFAGQLKGLLAPEEGRSRSTYLPVDAPQGMSIFDALISGQASPAIPQGIVDAIVGGVRGVESPAEYAKGIPSRADAVGDAFATAASAMAGGGVVSAPSGAMRANLFRRNSGPTFEEAPMVVQHNISPEGLAISNQIGGIPMPSIGIAGAKAPLENFGEVTLMLKPEKIAPRRDLPVYPADAYTGRQPRAFMDFVDEDQVRKNFRADPRFEHIGSSWLDSYSLDDADYMMKIVERGIDEKLIDPKNFDDFRKMYREAQAKLGADAYDAEVMSNAKGLSQYGDMQLSIAPEDWYTPSGNRRSPKPYTVEEAYKRMNKKKAYEAGAEQHSGAGLLRAVLLDKFKNLDDIKASRGLLRPSGNEMQDIKGSWDTMSYDAINDIAEKYFDGSHRKAEDYVTDVAMGKSGSWANAPDGARKATEKTLAKLKKEVKGMPTEYFEAKPRSVAQIGDFDAAVVPAGRQSVIDMLKAAGIKDIREYDDAVTGQARRDIIGGMEDYFFSNASPLGGLLAAQPSENNLSAIDSLRKLGLLAQ